MLSKETTKTIKLIKKSARHPKIMLVLLNHLSFLLKTEKVNINFVNDSLLRIIFLASSPRLCGQFTKTHSQDKKILEFLKTNKLQKSDTVISFKIKMIILYLINRPLEQLNLFILFELINSFSGQQHLHPYISRYILQLAMAGFHGIKMKREIPQEYFRLFLIKNAHFISNRDNFHDQKEETQFNIVKSIHLLIYSFSGVLYKFPAFSGIQLDITDFNSFFILDFLTIFAKNHKNTQEIRSIIPNDKDFIELMKKFLNNKLILPENNNTINFQALKNDEDFFLLTLKDELSTRKNCKNFIHNIRRIIDEAEQQHGN